VGLAVIFFTVIIKIILFPLSQKSVRTQFEMKKLEPELNEIKLKYKDDSALQAEKIMGIYKERNINPFAGIFLMLIQLPVLMALYYVFLKGGLPNLDSSSLYPFTKIPEYISMDFFGADVAKKNLYIAIFAALAQYLQIHFTLPKTQKNKETSNTFNDQLARSMNMQMKYVMPVFIFFIAKSFPAVVALYLITSCFFAIGQELYMRKKYGINLPKDK
jgi:YidC/Oxa1 family membrane protein insertase